MPTTGAWLTPGLCGVMTVERMAAPCPRSTVTSRSCLMVTSRRPTQEARLATPPASGLPHCGHQALRLPGTYTGARSVVVGAGPYTSKR
ncbi:MAG: hypothetical protein M3P47_05965 [Pseudomonadota bacterium]|nr:hypothetical protein [Pseudomonadota bacterium]